MKKTKPDPIADNLKRASFLVDLIEKRGAEISISPTMQGGYRVWITVPPENEPLGPGKAGKRTSSFEITED